MASPERAPRSITPRSIVATVLSVLVVFALGLVVALPARQSFDAKQVAQTQGQDLASKVLAVCQEGGDGAAPLLAIGACPLAQQVRSTPLAAPPQGGLTAEQVQALIKEEVARALRQPSKQQAGGPPGPLGPPGVAGLPGRSTSPGPAEQQLPPDNRVIEPPMVHEQAPTISQQPAPRYPQQQPERAPQQQYHAPQQQYHRAPQRPSHWPAPHGRPSHDWPAQPPHNRPPGQQQPPPYNRPRRQQPPYNPSPQQQQQQRPYNWPQQQQQQQPYNRPQQQQQPYQAPQQQQQQPRYNQQPQQQRMPSHQGSSLLTGVSGLLGGLGL
jgi:hypothetical protein